MLNGYHPRNGQPDVAWWQTELQAGIEWRNKLAEAEKWEQWHAMYRGKWKKDIVPINLFFMMARSLIPRVYFRNPSVSVQPTKPDPLNLASAVLVQRMDARLVKLMKLKQYMKRVAQWTWFYGTAGVKVGFGSEYMGSADVLKENAPSRKDTSKMEWKTEYRDNILKNMPFVLPIHTRDVVVPAGSVEQEATRWRAHLFERPLQDIKDDPRFKHADQLGPDSKQQNKPHESQVEMVRLAEVRDIQSGKVFVIPLEGKVDKPLLFTDDFLQFSNKSPIKLNVFNEDPEVIWGVPDSQILEPQQMEINEVRTQRMKHRRLALVKILYEENAITEEELQKLLGPNAGAGVQVKDLLGIELNQLVADIPQSLVVEEEMLMGDVREGQGMSRNQFGEFSRGGDTTATEATIVKMASELRVDERRDILSDLLVDIMHDVHRVVFELWTEEEVVDVLGPSGLPVYVAFRPRMLRDTRFELKVDPDTMVPETRQVRQQNSRELFALLQQNPIVNPVTLTAHLLREHGVVEFEQLLMQLDLGQGGLSQGNPLSAFDYARLLNGAQGNGPRGTNGAGAGTSSAEGPSPRRAPQNSAAGNGQAQLGGTVPSNMRLQ